MKTLLLNQRRAVGSVLRMDDLLYLVTECSVSEPYTCSLVSIEVGQRCMYIFKANGKQQLTHCKILSIEGSSIKIEYDHLTNRGSSYPHIRTLSSNTDRARLSLLNVPERLPTKSERAQREMWTHHSESI